MRVMLYSGGLDSYLLACTVPCDKYVYVAYQGDYAHGLVEAARSLLWLPNRPALTTVHMADSWPTTPATKEQRFRNPLMLLSVAASLNLTRRDILIAAIRDAGHMYADCSGKFCNRMDLLFESLRGPRLRTPVFLESLAETLERVRPEKLPKLQSCNRTMVKNCGRCQKCRVIRRAFRSVGRDHLWKQMNGQ